MRAIQTSHFATDEEGKYHHVCAKVSRTSCGFGDFSCHEDVCCEMKIFEQISMSSYPSKTLGSNHDAYSASRHNPEQLRMIL